MNKLKRFLIIFPLLLVLCVSYFSLAASAYAIYEKNREIILFGSPGVDLVPASFYHFAEFLKSNGVNIPDVNYTDFKYFSLMTKVDEDRYDYQIAFIKNDSYSAEYDGGQMLTFSEPTDYFVIRAALLRRKLDGEYYWSDNNLVRTGAGLYKNQLNLQLRYNLAADFYATNMTINGEMPDDYSASIMFEDNNSTFSFNLSNYSDNKNYAMNYGVEGLWSLSTMIPAGGNFRDPQSVQDLKDYAADHDLDYTTCTAFLDVIDPSKDNKVIEHITMSLADAVPEDGMFDHKKEYEDFPDPSDYFNDAPAFPDLEPFPDFPGWDGDHPWESLKEILLWIGNCILTPFKNLFLILKWLVSTIVYYICESIRYLKDCFLVLVHNIGVALYNLIVDLKALIKYLFVPKAAKIKNIFSEKLPIYDQLADAFNSVSTGTSSITITLFNRDVVIDPVTALGSRSCSILYSVSTVIIYALAAFGLFNYITSIFGISSSGGDE